MNEVEKVREIVERIKEARDDIQRLAEATARRMESIRVDTGDKEAIEEINEHILENYSILVSEGNSYVSAVPEIHADGSVYVVDDYGNAYGYNRLIPKGKYNIFASVEDVWAFYEAIEDLVRMAKKKGILKEVSEND